MTDLGARPLIAHLVGDYLLQTDHQAQTKTARSGPAVAHALTYALPFLALTRDPRRLAVIAGTHFGIDRWRLARYVVWAKNQAAPREHRYRLADAHPSGYSPGRPDWLVFWLLIAADNTLHLVVNEAALRWRP